MNSDAYTKILKDHGIDILFNEEPFQQDNDPAHILLKTRILFGIMDLLSWKIDPINLLISRFLNIYRPSEKEMSIEDDPTLRKIFAVMPERNLWEFHKI